MVFDIFVFVLTIRKTREHSRYMKTLGHGSITHTLLHDGKYHTLYTSTAMPVIISPVGLGSAYFMWVLALLKLISHAQCFSQRSRDYWHNDVNNKHGKHVRTRNWHGLGLFRDSWRGSSLLWVIRSIVELFPIEESSYLSNRNLGLPLIWLKRLFYRCHQLQLSRPWCSDIAMRKCMEVIFVLG